MSAAQVRALADEAQFGRKALLEAWAELVAGGEPAAEARHYVAERLTEMASPDQALAILDGDETIRGRQLRALALSRRAGDRDEREAVKILQRLWDTDRDAHSDAQLAETGGLLGGRYKKWYRRDGGGWLEKAYGVYKEAWELTQDPYPGINYAALALELGDRRESEHAARAVLRILEEAEGHDEWHHATVAEAHLLLSDPSQADPLEAARNSYRLAVRLNPSAAFNAAVMRRQARVELGLLGFPEDALDDVFPLKTVAAFSGHRLDAPDRPEPRFTAQMEGPVRLEIRAHLKERDVGFGIASGAMGGDILFLEEVLRKGGSARVLLPFPLERFKQESVGDDWWPRLERILADPMVQLIELLDEAPTEQSELERAFAACNDRIREEAIRLARELDQSPRLITVWDGKEGDGRGGTADAVASWKGQGLGVDRIDVGVTRGRGNSARSSTAERWMPQRRYCLAVGIDEYASLDRLYNAEGDAHAIADTLGQQHGFEPMTITGPDATLERISSYFHETLIPNVTPDDLVVVYYSGHGEVWGDGYYLSTVDAERDPPDRWIDFGLLREWSATLRCRQLLWVFDSCHSGMLYRIVIDDLADPDPSWARLALTSGRQTEKVRDGVPGDHSPFARALLDAMREGPRPRYHADEFTADELGIWLKERVRQQAGQTPQYVQLPDHEGGDIVFRVPQDAATG